MCWRSFGIAGEEVWGRRPKGGGKKKKGERTKSKTRDGMWNAIRKSSLHRLLTRYVLGLP